MLLVGFGTDPATGVDYFKIRNSWGAGWGEAGFIRLGRGDQFGALGECGVQSQGFFATTG